jgi:hypothetical protein
MTPFEQFIQNFNLSSNVFNFWIFIKILFVIGFALYVAFNWFFNGVLFPKKKEKNRIRSL